MKLLSGPLVIAIALSMSTPVLASQTKSPKKPTYEQCQKLAVARGYKGRGHSNKPNDFFPRCMAGKVPF